jgi:hypothetical protein
MPCTALRDAYNFLLPPGATAHSGPWPPHSRGFTITLRYITVDRIPLDECSVLPRDLFLTTHNNHKRQTSMLPAGFEPAISACERPQTQALDGAATGIGTCGDIPISALQTQHLFIKNVTIAIDRNV